MGASTHMPGSAEAGLVAVCGAGDGADVVGPQVAFQPAARAPPGVRNAHPMVTPGICARLSAARSFQT
ncbi:unnamed protein product [[Actinomadura] parvosata subsp. kistnae]|nr:unnamed protein product [Actinomadura parvosata subsp. kistnae]